MIVGPYLPQGVWDDECPFDREGHLPEWNADQGHGYRCELCLAPTVYLYGRHNKWFGLRPYLITEEFELDID